MPSPYNIVQGLVSGPVLTVVGWGGALTTFISTTSTKVRDIATWAYSNNYFIPTDSTITGTVRENITPIPYCDVYIYFKENGFLIANTKTDINGNFSFNALDSTNISGSDNERYFIVAQPDGYNAKISDKLYAPGDITITFGAETPTDMTIDGILISVQLEELAIIGTGNVSGGAILNDGQLGMLGFAALGKVIIDGGLV